MCFTDDFYFLANSVSPKHKNFQAINISMQRNFSFLLWGLGAGVGCAN
jgi:hypothetical protein